MKQSKWVVFILAVTFIIASTVTPAHAYECYYRKVLNVPTYKQEKSHWCGPACLQMVIKQVTGSKISQTALAQQAETAPPGGGGTIVWKMSRTLNQRGVGSDYYYVRDAGYSFFDATLQRSLNMGIPGIAHLLTRRLPVYGGRNYGHYVVIRGRYIHINDPSVEPYSIFEPRCTTRERTAGAFAAPFYFNELYYTDPYDGINGVYGRHTVPPLVMFQAINDNAGYLIAAN